MPRASAESAFGTRLLGPAPRGDRRAPSLMTPRDGRSYRPKYRGLTSLALLWTPLTCACDRRSRARPVRADLGTPCCGTGWLASDARRLRSLVASNGRSALVVVPSCSRALSSGQGCAINLETCACRRLLRRHALPSIAPLSLCLGAIGAHGSSFAARASIARVATQAARRSSASSADAAPSPAIFPPLSPHAADARR